MTRRSPPWTRLLAAVVARWVPAPARVGGCDSYPVPESARAGAGDRERVGLPLRAPAGARTPFAQPGVDQPLQPALHVLPDRQRRAATDAGLHDAAHVSTSASVGGTAGVRAPVPVGGSRCCIPSFARWPFRPGPRGARTLVTTNATRLNERGVDDLLDANVDRVTVSVDGDASTHEAVRGVPLARTEAGLERFAARARSAGQRHGDRRLHGGCAGDGARQCCVRDALCQDR